MYLSEKAASRAYGIIFAIATNETFHADLNVTQHASTQKGLDRGAVIPV